MYSKDKLYYAIENLKKNNFPKVKLPGLYTKLCLATLVKYG